MLGKRILVVDDDKNIVKILKLTLEKEGFEVLSAHNGKDGLEMARAEKPDLLILDQMMPQMTGRDTLVELRKESSIPVIMATTESAELDQVLSLELGADDFIPKPVSPRTVVARVKALLRRVDRRPYHLEQQLQFGELTIDLIRHEVTKGNERVDLRPLEMRLLSTLASHPGKAFTRDELMREVWGYEDSEDSRTVDVHIRQLRQQLESHPNQYIRTVRGVGYKFDYRDD